MLCQDLPVYTDISLKWLKQSEIGIDIPLDTEFIQVQDEYTQNMALALEEDTHLNSEVIIFQLKKQIIQSGIANSELIRCYYDTQCKLNLLKEKFNLKQQLLKHQDTKISLFENMVDHMHNSYNKLIVIIQKLENDHWNKEKTSDHIGRGKIIRPLKAFVRPNPVITETPTFVRRVKRLKTSATVLKPSKYEETDFKSSFNEHNDDVYKIRTVETNLHLQTLFNQQMRSGYEHVKNECNIFKSLLENYQKQNMRTYIEEKERWKSFIEGFKVISDRELIRKQNEINGLNKILGIWIKKYIDSNGYMNDSKNKKSTDDLENLIQETRISIRPSKMSLLNSPFHIKFKKPENMTLTSQYGDCSPPSFED